MFRILSLDGGGVRGIISAVMLAHVEQQLELPLHQRFDLIAGTSAGAILGSAIATGFSANWAVEMIKKNAPSIFPYRELWNPGRLPLLFKHGFSAPKFSHLGLECVLRSTLKDKRCGDVNTKLLITSFDTIMRSPIIFKSWHDYFDSVPLWEAVLCSASAPTYFPAHKLVIKGDTYSAIDGGIVANNPSMCAIAEALRLGHKLEDISLLSVGTGDATRPISAQFATNAGGIDWAFSIVDLLLESPNAASHYQASQLLGDRYLRMQFKLDRILTGKRLSDDIDDASFGNVNNLIEATLAYTKQPPIQRAIELWLS